MKLNFSTSKYQQELYLSYSSTYAVQRQIKEMTHSIFKVKIVYFFIWLLSDMLS